MHVYKTPESGLEINEEVQFKPVKAIVFSLSISIILLTILSNFFAIVFAIVLGVDFSIENEFDNVLNSSFIYLLIDLVISSIVLYFVGTIINNYVSGKETIYIVIVSVITIIYYEYLFDSSGYIVPYPLWYDLSSSAIVPIFIYVGSKYKKT